MSVYKPKNSPFYHFDFQVGGHRFHGSTQRKTRREAEQVEEAERAKAQALVDLHVKGSTGPLTVDVAADRYWIEAGQHRSNANDLERDIARLVDYLGKDKLLTDVTDSDVARLVAWRRGHYRWGRKSAGLVSPAQVNRSTTEVLQRIITRALNVWKIPTPAGYRAPDWKQHLLEEPQERVRELQQDEDARLADVFDPDYEELRQFSIASGLRMQESLLTWRQVDFANARIIRKGKGGRMVYLPMTNRMRDILIGRKGHHPIFVFTYLCRRGVPKLRLKGRRYPITKSGLKTHWRRRRAKAGVTDYRWHDNRHTFATNLLRETSNLKLVKRALNHQKIETTDKYSHVLDDEVRAGMQEAERNRVTKSRNQSRNSGEGAA